MSEKDINTYKNYIGNLDITKYILKDKEDNYWYSTEYVDKMFKKQDKEIERLNNIINELEKWLVERIDEYKEMELYDNASAYDYTLYTLKELKGSDKVE